MRESGVLFQDPEKCFWREAEYEEAAKIRDKLKRLQSGN